MKFNNNVQSDVQASDGVVQEKVGIDIANVDWIIQILSTNLYQNPIGSFLRETISNAWDSHVEAGVTDPVLVEIYEDSESNCKCRVTDFGVGISPERFNKIYRNIGSSTKRDTNNQIGGFGIGRFSALAYADSVQITSTYQGNRTTYIMYRDSNSISIDTLFTEIVQDSRNGVSVEVPVLEHNVHDFNVYMERHMCFFENVVYRNTVQYSVFNELKIKKFTDGNFTLVSGRSKGRRRSKEQKLLLGKVAYDIPFSISTPSVFNGLHIGIHFDIGELQPTPNREGIVINSVSKKLIEDRIQGVVDVLKKISQAFYKPIDISGLSQKDKLTFYNDAIREEKHSFPSLLGVDMPTGEIFKDNTIPYDANNVKFDIGEGVVLTYRDLKQSHKKSFKNVVDHTNLFTMYSIGASAIKAYKSYHWFNFTSKDFNIHDLMKDLTHKFNHNLYQKFIVADKSKLTKVEASYLRHLAQTSNGHALYLINPATWNIVKQELDNYVPTTGFETYFKDTLFNSKFFKTALNIETLDEITIPQDFIDSFKNKKKTTRVSGNISFKTIERSQGYSSYCKLVPMSMLAEKFIDKYLKAKGLCVYAVATDKQDLDLLKSLYELKNKSISYCSEDKLIVISKTMSDKFEETPNMVNVKEYLTRNYKFARDYASYLFISKIAEDFKYFVRHVSHNSSGTLLFPNAIKILDWAAGYKYLSTIEEFIGQESICRFIELGLMNEMYDLYWQHQKEFHAYLKTYVKIYVNANIKGNTDMADWFFYQDIVKNKIFMPPQEAVLKCSKKREINLNIKTKDEYYNTLCSGNSDDQTA